MTKQQAALLLLKYKPILIGKPLAKDLPIPIDQVEVRKLDYNDYQVQVSGEMDSGVEKVYRFLLDYLKEFEIPFEKGDFGVKDNEKD